MPNGGLGRGKMMALIVLGALCAWLVYRNLLSPAGPTVSASLPAAAARGSSVAAASPRKGSEHDPAMNSRELAALDPTLRLDVLEKSREIEYEGGARNIFQVYTPPPPPPMAPPGVSSQPAAGQANPTPPALNIPLKFYGVSDRQGATKKKAFLTDGEEIFIGEEGAVIAKRYRIVRIGVNSIELEDTQSQKRQQLPLAQE